MIDYRLLPAALAPGGSVCLGIRRVRRVRHERGLRVLDLVRMVAVGKSTNYTIYLQRQLVISNIVCIGLGRCFHCYFYGCL